MSMTREEAIELLCYGDWLNVISEHIGKQDTERIAEAMSIVGKALRPVSREQVEKMRGEWDYPECEWNLPKCPKCGCNSKDATYGHKSNFCPRCGAPMTDKSVDILWKRLEAMQDAAD